MPARRGPSDLTFLAGAGLAMAALAVVSFLLAPPDSSPAAPGSSYSADPDGTKAAYVLLKELGYDLQRSFEPIAEQRLTSPATVFVLASPLEKPSSRDIRALQNFVERGGIVLAFGPSAGLFLPGVGAQKMDRRERPMLTFYPALPGPLTANAPELNARGRFRPALDSAYLPVYAADREVGVVTARFGHGRVIWCLDDTPVRNSGIGRTANVHFLVNAVTVGGKRPILWDEHYHGQRRSLWSYLSSTPLPWAGVQLGIVALATLAAVSRRRGPVWSRGVQPRTSPLEFIDTMAALYERADASREAIESARTRFRRRLASAAALPTSSTDDQLITIAAARVGIDAQRARAALGRAADMLRRGVPRGRDAVPVVAELQHLTALASARGAQRQGITDKG
jgi:Domain of unknown function (DUF4350)